MKKSGSVVIGLVQGVAAAALLAGYGCGKRNEVTQVCVDGAQTVVQNQRCEDQGRPSSGGAGGGFGGSNGTYPGYSGYGGYHWYYLPGRTEPAIGTRVTGGNFSAPEGAHVTRGGLGGSADAHGSSSGRGAAS